MAGCPMGGHNPFTYTSYLKIDELLSLQNLKSDHHDEMLFILIHQVYELWFKSMLHEMNALTAAIDDDSVPLALKVLKRIITVQKVLLSQLDVLETMTPTEFAKFRDNLRPASGFQSFQFRLIEFLSGQKKGDMIAMFDHLPVYKEQLIAAYNAPTVFDHVVRLLYNRGFDIPLSAVERDVTQPYESNEAVLDVLGSIYAEPDRWYDLYLLCETLIDYDEHFSFWRFRHVKMVERTIGSKTGTGGSSGAEYLRTTVDGRFFPDLWNIRNRIGSY